MQASDAFRSRRPPSPHHRNALTNPGPMPQPRFPQHPQAFELLTADEKRDAVRQDSEGRPVLTRKVHAGGFRKMTPGEWKLLIGVCLLAAFIRLWRLSQPNSVVFDEVHFGKFATKYIKTRYYVDVHPPLAKLLLTLAGALGGLDVNFDFKEIGKIYEKVPYVFMRSIPATLGLALVPITYLTLRALECGTSTALLGSILVTFENGLITQSRLILLDSFLLFFTGLSIFFWSSFCNEDKRKPFTEVWWAWLILTGLALGAVVSCKWVGLFTIATVGLSTVKQLWVLLGDQTVSARTFTRHFWARAVCLIIVPLVFYMAMFEIHFAILQNSGDGDGFMSAEFQHTLGGRGMKDEFADVAYGSTVTIRHLNTQGGYLHSHSHNYPSGSKQQQITLYPHRDSNNNWKIINATADNDINWHNKLHWITNGMVIRLEHSMTEKRLHSHDHRPPVSEVDFQNEVSGYGFPGFAGDANDNWIVEIEYADNGDKEALSRLRTINSKFRLRHQLTGCYLFSHKVKLPDWAFEQQEVTCNKNAVKPNSFWFIESNENALLPPDAPKVNYRLPGFFGKFLELQAVMWRTNAGLTDRHAYDSRPHQWPTLRRGINFWVKDHRQIYLIGNPFVWYLGTASVLLYVAVRGLLILRAKRGYKDFHHTAVVKYDNLTGFLVMGYALHYLPFFIMQRQLFLHHYFPALWFSILTSCAIFDLLTSSLSPRKRIQIAGVLMIIAIWNYTRLSPLAYGNPWTKSQCRSAKLLKTWDFSCNDFYDDISKYKTLDTTTSVSVQTPVPAGDSGAPAAPRKNEKPPKADVKTTEALVEKVEPGRDIFAEPIQVNEIKLPSTLDAAEAKKKQEEEEKKKAEEDALKTKQGPLSPSEAAVADAIRIEEEKQQLEDGFEDVDEKEKASEAKKSSTVAAKVEETVADDKTGVDLADDSKDTDEDDDEEVKIQTAPEKAPEKVVEKVVEKVTEKKKKVVEQKKKPQSPEEAEAERVRKELFNNEEQ